MARPRRPVLSDLISRLGPVIDANPGEYLPGELDDSFMEQARRAPRLPGCCYRVNCPFCTDTQQSLWVSYRWGERTHWRRPRDLRLAVCYHRDCLSRPGVAQELCDFVFGGSTHWLMPDPVRGGHRLVVTGWPVKKPGELSWRLSVLEDDHPAVVYLRSRGYDTRWLGHTMRVRSCEISHPEYPMARDRIIFPIIQGFTYLGWLARHVGEPADPRVPTYIAMPGMDTSQVLFNFDKARKFPFVVVCAEALDACAFGLEAVALLGRTVSAAQAELIAAAWGRGTAVILLGGDARGEAREAHDALAGLVRRRVIVTLPDGKGPGDFPREALRQIVFDAARQQGADLGALPVPGGSGQ
jgi:hypothetical protein